MLIRPLATNAERITSYAHRTAEAEREGDLVDVRLAGVVVMTDEVELRVERQPYSRVTGGRRGGGPDREAGHQLTARNRSWTPSYGNAPCKSVFGIRASIE